MTNEPAARRAELLSLLGDLPPLDRPITAETVAVEERDGQRVETLRLDLNGLEAVPATFVKPLNAPGPLPAVLYNHWHGGQYGLGRRELLEGNDGQQEPPYAQVLADAGCAALCIDHWCFGERRHNQEADLFKEFLWQGRTLWGMMVYDSLRAVDYLTTRPDVDAARLGTLGMSMGSTMAWWLAALDTRIAACVDICCLTDFDALIAAKGLGGHSVYYFVPGLLKHFTTGQINALIAPRPHLSVAGNLDALTPALGLDRLDCELRAVYAAVGAPDGWRLFRQDVGHTETPEMRREIRAFLHRHLIRR